MEREFGVEIGIIFEKNYDESLVNVTLLKDTLNKSISALQGMRRFLQMQLIRKIC